MGRFFGYGDSAGGVAADVQPTKLRATPEERLGPHLMENPVIDFKKLADECYSEMNGPDKDNLARLENYLRQVQKLLTERVPSEQALSLAKKRVYHHTFNSKKEEQEHWVSGYRQGYQDGAVRI